MTAHAWDPYLEGNSAVHRLEASTKLLLVIAYLLTTALLPPGAWMAYFLLLGIAAVWGSWADINPLTWFKRSTIAVPFALAALPLLFTQTGETLFQFSIFRWTLTASDMGLVRLLSILSKSCLSVMVAVVLTATTPMPDMLSGLRRLGLPRLLTAMIGLMWRYLFLMIDEAGRLMTARSSRSGKSKDTPSGKYRPGGSLIWRAGVTGGMAGSLFLRSIERSERVYAAMLARGYDGEIRNLPLPPTPLWNWIVLGGGVSCLVCILALTFLGWGIS